MVKSRRPNASASSPLVGRLADITLAFGRSGDHPFTFSEEEADFGYRDAFTDDRGKRWSVKTTWDWFDRRLEPVQVTIQAIPPVPLTAEALRRLPLGTRFDVARREMAVTARGMAAGAPQWEELTGEEHTSWVALIDETARARGYVLTEAELAADAESAYRRWVGGFTDDERAHAGALAEGLQARKGRTLTTGDLEVVADVYRAAWRQGANPRHAVAEQFHLSDSGAAKRIRAARGAGLLGPARPGKAGEV
jgi:hypothetical protein